VLTNTIIVAGKDNAQKYTFSIIKLLMKILVKYNFETRAFGLKY